MSRSRARSGIHSHVGSGIHDPSNWTRVGESLFGLLQATQDDGEVDAQR